MKSYSQITTRYLKQNKKRTALTIVGIILAVSLFSGIGNFFLSMRDSIIERQKKNTGNYVVSYVGVEKSKLNKLNNNFEVENYGVEKQRAEIKFKENGQISNIELYLLDKNMFNKIRTFKIVEGKIPNAKGEILLEERAKRKLNKNLNDYIKLDKEYKIVGFYQPEINAGGNCYNVMAFMDDDSLNENEKVDVYLNLKEKKNIRKVGIKVGETLGLKYNKENIDKSQIRFNEELLKFMLQSSSEIMNEKFVNILIILIGFIILCTVAVIYNAFNISVAERINQFGILRSIGATPSKIRKLVFKEAFIMAVIGIPIGIFAGYLGIYITVALMSKSKFFIFNNLQINFYPQVILLSAFLGIITIVLSVLGPARTASKISPIDAIRNSSSLKKEKIKRRNGFISKLLFGVEGNIAYKNIRRNNKRFLITVFSLMISFVMFVVFTSYIKIGQFALNNLVLSMPWDAGFDARGQEITESFIKEIKSKEEIEEIYIQSVRSGVLYVEDKYVNKDFYKKSSNIKEPEKEKIKGKNYAIFPNVKYEYYDENSFKLAEKYLQKGKIDINELNKGGVILVNTGNSSKKDGGKVIDNIFKYKVGDTIKIPLTSNQFDYELGDKNQNDKIDHNKMNKEAIESNKFINVKIVAILDREPIQWSNTGECIDLIFSRDYFTKTFGEYKVKTMGFNFKNEQCRKKIEGYLEDRATDLNFNYIDFSNYKAQLESVQVQLSVFIYGFITIISIIGIVNIINTITIGILLRKSEFATLMAIGMTKGQLKKMVMLEGILHGVIVSIFGSGVSFGVLKILQIQSEKAMFIPFDIPINIFVIGIIGIIVLTTIASLIPLKRLKNMSIMQNIRAQE